MNYHAASGNPFLHTWSLAVEQQFYVLWPLLFALIGRIYGASGVTPRRLIAWVTAAGVLSFIVSLWVTKSPSHGHSSACRRESGNSHSAE